MIFETKRADKMVDVINSSITSVQFETRKATYDRLISYLDISDNDEEFYALAWNDFPVWSAAFVDDDSNNPLFPARWQIEYAKLMEERKYVWSQCSRKVGKSTLLAVKNVHDLCGPIPKRIICLAPTLKQDYVFDKMNKYLSLSPYLYRTFLSEGSLTRDYIKTTNGSSAENRTIGLNSKGELVRGEYGDIVTIDEVQTIDDTIMNQIVRPILADAYSTKRLRLLGTPNLYSNPNLENNWKLWVRDSKREKPEYGYMQVDWKRGVEEGCLDRKYVLAEKERLPPDEFRMEYEALFPDQSGRYFGIEILQDALINESFEADRTKEHDYIMAVDWAAFRNRTQILVGRFDYMNKLIKYINWKEIDPKREKIDYENQVDIVKDVFWRYDCRWICPDATSNQDALVRMLVTGARKIPEGRFFKTRSGPSEGASERLGYCASDTLNNEMWRNHKQQLTARRIKIPMVGDREKEFVEKWMREHNELDAKMIRNGNLVKLEEPDGGFKDLAVTSAMLSLYFPVVDRGRAADSIISW